jgi:hypothetical protein
MTTVPQADGEHAASGSNSPVPVIVIAGKEWHVPLLSPKQNRIIVPALLDVVPRIIQMGAPADPSKQTGEPVRLDTPTYDRLTDIVFHALTRAHPELTRADFDDMAIDTAELFAAVNVIARQAGLLKPVDPAR